MTMFYVLIFITHFVQSKTYQREGLTQVKMGDLFALNTRCALPRDITQFEIKRLHAHHVIPPDVRDLYHNCNGFYQNFQLESHCHATLSSC